jgi:hypothetical protein
MTLRLVSSLCREQNTAEENSVFESVSLKIPSMAAGKTQSQHCIVTTAA